jgi:hypothetical protein
VNAVAKWGLIAVAGVFALGLIGTFGVMAFVFSIGTAVVPITLETSVLDRDTKAPVARCLLAFQKGGNGLTRPATIDYGQTTERSDANGRLRVDSSYEHVGSMFWPFPRERKPGFRFYLGEAPRYDTPDQVESWLVTLRFDEPWTRSEVAPALAVERSLAHEEGRKQSGGFDRLPAEPVERLAQARVRFEKGASGRDAYAVGLSLFLDEKQIARCQAASPRRPGEVRRRSVQLQALRRVARGVPRGGAPQARLGLGAARDRGLPRQPGPFARGSRAVPQGGRAGAQGPGHPLLVRELPDRASEEGGGDAVPQAGRARA